MGLLDFLGDLADIGKDIVMLPVEIGKAVAECAVDINETIGQDIKNKANGTPDKPIRTSFDIRNEADEIVHKANRTFYDAKNKLTSLWYNTSKVAEGVAERRKKIYNLLGKTVNTSLEKLPEQPLQLVYPSNAPYVSPSFDVGTYFGALGTGIRMDAAEEYLQQAKEYQVEVHSLINDIDALRRTVLNFSNAQKEELAMLDIIEEAYKVKSGGVLTESAKLLHDIATICWEEISTNTDKKYYDLLRQLKCLWS